MNTVRIYIECEIKTEPNKPMFGSPLPYIRMGDMTFVIKATTFINETRTIVRNFISVIPDGLLIEDEKAAAEQIVKVVHEDVPDIYAANPKIKKNVGWKKVVHFSEIAGRLFSLLCKHKCDSLMSSISEREDFRTRDPVMTENEKTEKLLWPRFEFMEPYPGSEGDYEVGQIIEVVPQMGMGSILESLYRKYPKNFKELKWHEKRAVHEMPDYFIMNNGAVVKAIAHFTDNPCHDMFAVGHDIYPWCIFYDYVQIATLEQYEEYINGGIKKQQS